MDKDKQYQMYLKELSEGYGIKRMFFKLAKKNESLLKLYLRLTNISVKKIKKIPNIKNEKIRILDMDVELEVHFFILVNLSIKMLSFME